MVTSHTHTHTHTHTHFIILNVGWAFSILLFPVSFSLADKVRKWLGSWTWGSGRPGCNFQVQSFASCLTLGNVYNLIEHPSEKGRGLPGASMLKNLPAMQEPQKMQVPSLGPLEDPLEEGMATHSSILAWRIPWTEEPGGLQSIEWQSQT